MSPPAGVFSELYRARILLPRGLYYRDRLDPADVVALGWPGRVFAPGDWGSIVNGGAWVLSYPMSGLVLA